MEYWSDGFHDGGTSDHYSTTPSLRLGLITSQHARRVASASVVSLLPSGPHTPPAWYRVDRALAAPG